MDFQIYLAGNQRPVVMACWNFFSVNLVLSSIAILKLVFKLFNTKFNWCVPKHGDFWISVFQYIEIKKSPWFKHGEFWISVFQYTEIQKSPCIETWRFCKQSCSHFWISVFQYMEIQKSPCIKHRNF